MFLLIWDPLSFHTGEIIQRYVRRHGFFAGGECKYVVEWWIILSPNMTFVLIVFRMCFVSFYLKGEVVIILFINGINIQNCIT